MPRHAPDPIRLPDKVWHDPAVLDLCRHHDGNGLLRLARKYGNTNESIGYWTGLDPAEISKRTSPTGTKANSPITSLDRWQRLADAFAMPDHARLVIGIAPVDRAPDQSGGPAGAVVEDVAPLSLDVIRRVEASDVGPATLEALHEATERLCRAYPSTAAQVLRTRGQQQLQQVLHLLDGRATLAQRRELLVTGGWLALLVGCVEYDLGLSQAAETTRRAAASLGREAGHGAVIAWSYEMAAWMAITRGDYREAVDYAQAGGAAERQQSVAVQLAAQEAKGLARLGELHEMERALDRGRALLEGMPRPEHPEHHFVIDPDKWDFYAMDCYRLSGQDAKARAHAVEVIRLGTRPDGTERSPMRVAEARVTLGVVAANDGELDEAVDQGTRAFSSERKSLPSLLSSARELRDLLNARYPAEDSTDDFLDVLRSARRVQQSGTRK